jgi:hypothetical protein
LQFAFFDQRVKRSVSSRRASPRRAEIAQELLMARRFFRLRDVAKDGGVGKLIL